MKNPIYIPGFSAAASLRRTGRAYSGKGVAHFARNSTVVPQRSAFGSASAIGATRLGFNCAPWGCVCTGDADCNDMFSTNACGPWAICIDNVCFCGR
jgi:hypothetical protein